METSSLYKMDLHKLTSKISKPENKRSDKKVKIQGLGMNKIYTLDLFVRLWVNKIN